MIKLFNISEINPPDFMADAESGSVSDKDLNEQVKRGNAEVKIHHIVGFVKQGDCISFWSNGDWSLWELVAHLLKQTGLGTEVYLATWSISELSARKLCQWMDEGLISKLVGVIDFRSKNRHPAAYHLSKNVFSEIRVAFCHAKVTVLKGNGHCITINGSANWTENPRLESGVIINSFVTGDKTIELINEIVTKGEYKLDD
jgi:hypothetical protein